MSKNDLNHGCLKTERFIRLGLNQQSMLKLLSHQTPVLTKQKTLFFSKTHPFLPSYLFAVAHFSIWKSISNTLPNALNYPKTCLEKYAFFIFFCYISQTCLEAQWWVKTYLWTILILICFSPWQELLIGFMMYELDFLIFRQLWNGTWVSALEMEMSSKWQAKNWHSSERTDLLL